jgi:uncharacterized Ntn-hydrolase superfamily protein
MVEQIATAEAAVRSTLSAHEFRNAGLPDRERSDLESAADNGWLSRVQQAAAVCVCHAAVSWSSIRRRRSELGCRDE